MAYNRTPNTVLAGRGLKQSPSQTGSLPAGVVTVTVDSDIATDTTLGVVQVGDGLSITSTGILSATGSGTGLLNVSLVAVDYTTTNTNYYIGATKKGITITLALGIVGKVFIVKNQSSEGSIKVQGSGGQKIDSSTFKTLGEDASLIAVFDGTRWNLI